MLLLFPFLALRACARWILLLLSNAQPTPLQLRGEPGIFYEDLYPLVSFLPQHAEGDNEFKSKHDVLPLWSSTSDLLKVHHDADAAPPPEELRRAHASMSEHTHVDPEKHSTDTATGPKLPPGAKILPARLPPKKSAYGM